MPAFKSLIQADKTLSPGFNSGLRPRLCRVLLSLPLLQDPEPYQESGDDRSSFAARVTAETLKGLCSGKQGGESAHRSSRAGIKDRGETWTGDIPDA